MTSKRLDKPFIMLKMKFRPALYGSLLLATLLLGACREKRPKQDFSNDFCPANPGIFPEIDTGVVLIPNAFSPNGDGKNDVWKPVFKNIKTLEIKIIDATGNILFHSNGLYDGWELVNGAQSGMTKYLAWVKATSTMGNVMENCTYIYAYYCTPQNPPVEHSLLQFGDQLDPNAPGTYRPTMESFTNCN